MFSEFFEGEYETKKFWIKGLEEDIEGREEIGRK